MKQNKVKKRLNSCDKFTFSIEFQLEVLRFLIQGKESLLYLKDKAWVFYSDRTFYLSRSLDQIC